MTTMTRAYIATKAVRHVAIYSAGNWRAVCRRGLEWDYRDDFDSFVWDADPNYDDKRWLLPVCKHCVAVVAELRFTVDHPDPS